MKTIAILLPLLLLLCGCGAERFPTGRAGGEDVDPPVIEVEPSEQAGSAGISL